MKSVCCGHEESNRYEVIEIRQLGGVENFFASEIECVKKKKSEHLSKRRGYCVISLRVVSGPIVVVGGDTR